MLVLRSLLPKMVIGNFSNASHLAWLYDIYLRTGIRVPFPIIADRNGTIARKYGMISNDISNTETVRNVFIIDDKGIVKAILVYPMNVGRSVPEILRLLTALQSAQENDALTPANWYIGEPLIKKAPKTFKEMEETIGYMNENKNGMSWYLSFNKPVGENKQINIKDETKKLK